MSKEKPEENIVAFGASCKVFPSVNKKPAIAEPELTVDQKIENINANTTNMFAEHANALNSIALWIADQDPQVAKAGNVVNWAMKKMAKEQRLAERKAAYKANKDGTV